MFTLDQPGLFDRLERLMSVSRRRAVLIVVILAGLLRIDTNVHAQLGGILLPPPSTLHWEKLDPLLVPAASQLTGHSQVIVRAQSPAYLGLVGLLVQQVGGVLGLS